MPWTFSQVMKNILQKALDVFTSNEKYPAKSLGRFHK